VYLELMTFKYMAAIQLDNAATPIYMAAILASC